MKIVHLSSVHPAFDTRIFHKECTSLAEHGYEVVLVAPTETKACVGNVRVRALRQPRNRFERMTRTVWAVYRAALDEKGDLYHFHDPELLPVGLLLRLRGRRVIYDVHEDVPQSIYNKPWIPRWLRGIVGGGAAAVEWLGGRFLNGVVAATPSIAKRFPPSKVSLVQNFPLLSELASPGSLGYLDRPPAAAYMGGISEIRGAGEMVRAVGLVADKLDARLRLAGNFSESALEEQLRQMDGWAKVEYLEYLSREELGEMLGNVRMGLVLFHPGPNHTESQPNKLFEYMSTGIPVIASDFPLWRKFVMDTGCGMVVDPLNPQAVADAIAWLLEHPKEAEAMGRRGRHAVENQFNWENEKLSLLALYEKVLAQ